MDTAKYFLHGAGNLILLIFEGFLLGGFEPQPYGLAQRGQTQSTELVK